MKQPKYYVGCSPDIGECHDCGRKTDLACPNNGYPLCEYCNKRREEAYDRYVDPLGFYSNKNFDLD
jgi:anaerobic ribonucleoside-triphosphate reductase